MSELIALLIHLLPESWSGNSFPMKPSYLWPSHLYALKDLEWVGSCGKTSLVVQNDFREPNSCWKQVMGQTSLLFPSLSKDIAFRLLCHTKVCLGYCTAPRLLEWRWACVTRDLPMSIPNMQLPEPSTKRWMERRERLRRMRSGRIRMSVSP